MAITFKTIYLPENEGHGNARRVSLDNCENELVALMDADDISIAHRFEKQLSVFKNNADVDIVGGQISEFIGVPTNITGNRVVPLHDLEIKSYMKKRCPMNQVSVMFKKSFVEKVGGYIDWFCEEDYYLWIRMAEANGKFANVLETLVNVRVGDEMSSRRGGWKYFSSEAKLQGYMLKKGIISIPRYLYNIAIRFGGEVIVPDKIRTKLFKLMREENRKENQTMVTNRTDLQEVEYPPFSVAMCVYGGDNPEWFDTALGSVIDQTVKPNEIVLVVDGPVPDCIQKIIDKYISICNV
jgi:glycosyltransferase involved in cell wall biosynthesis